MGHNNILSLWNKQTTSYCEIGVGQTQQHLKAINVKSNYEIKLGVGQTQQHLKPVK